MFLAVWILYAADRLLDARPLLTSASAPELEERHRFHHRHRGTLLPLLALAALPLAALLHHSNPAVLHLYIMLASLLGGWLLIVHAGPSPGARRLPKEFAVGIFFPAAVFIPTVARAPWLRVTLLPSALLFAAVCTLNCLFLYAWEHPGNRNKAHGSTRWCLDHLTFLATVVALLSGVLGLGAAWFPDHIGLLRALPRPWAMPLACLVSTCLLLLLDRRWRSFHPVRLRAWADLVLLTPVPAVLAARLFAHLP